MKKIYSLLFLCSFLLVSSLPVRAEIVAPSSEEATNPNFDLLKQRILTRVSDVISQLNTLENQIETNPQITPATKQGVLDVLKIVKSGLLSYQNEVIKATTIEELTAANQGIIRYLQDNRQLIRENLKKVVVDLAEQAAQKIEEFKAEVDQLLQTLKVTCPSEKETIIQLEAQLEQLETDIATLKQAIKTQDTATIKQTIEKIILLSEDIVKNLEKIEANCQI